jgi:hypothetical protein
MDWTTILIIVVALALLALFLYNRSRPAPPGTYNDRDLQSGGSIGGGRRTYDDPDVESSGSIGGGKRAHDDPGLRSRGSIGGDDSVRSGEERSMADATKGDYTHADRDQHSEYDRVQERRSRTYDDKDVQSSGSIGGNSR